MKNLLIFSLVGGICVGLSGCGHHVVYQQVVKTDNTVNHTQYSAQHNGLMPAPVMIQSQAQSSHVRGVVLQQSSANGVAMPAGQVHAMITPQQNRTLQLVPSSSLNRQGVVYQSSTVVTNAPRGVPMIRIPVLAIPAQAVQVQTMPMAQSLQATQVMQSAVYAIPETQAIPQSGSISHLDNRRHERYEHLKATPAETQESPQDKETF